MDLGSIIKGIVVAGVTIFVIAFIAAIGIAFWPYLLALAAVVIGGRMYLKRQQRARNMV